MHEGILHVKAALGIIETKNFKLIIYPKNQNLSRIFNLKLGKQLPLTYSIQKRKKSIQR